MEDHFREVLPEKLFQQAEFDIVTDWLVALGQLALKIEWVVTSLDRASVSAKAGDLWDDINRYERNYPAELEKIAPEAMQARKSIARTLIEGANPDPDLMVTGA